MDLLMHMDTVNSFYCSLWMPQQMDMLLYTDIVHIIGIVIIVIIVIFLILVILIVMVWHSVEMCKHVLIALGKVDHLRLFLSKWIEEGSFLCLCSPVFYLSLVEEGRIYNAQTKKICVNTQLRSLGSLITEGGV